MEKIIKEKLDKISVKAYEAAYTKILTDLYKEQISYQITSKEDTVDPYILKLREVNKTVAKLRKHAISSHYYFVSVASKVGCGFDEFTKKLNKYVTRKMVVGAYYTIEWSRGAEINQPHCHILVYQDSCSDRDFRKNTQNTFKTIVGNLKCIDIKRVPEDWVIDKIQYIKGEKWDKEKEELMVIDRMRREELGLQEWYQTGNVPLLDEGTLLR